MAYDYPFSDDENSELGPLKQEWPFGGEGSKLLARADRQADEYSFGGRADTLPIVASLVVKDVGPGSVPLTEEEATNLIGKSKKSPFGHKFETKLDENVRNSWQLEPDQVEINNPQWHTGIEEITATIAARLGYEGVPLSCQLYKMLIYGQGGHFVKHQDTEKEDGMIATLVVQLPSLHEGGDLVIYRGGRPLHRHDFGKADGSAGYFPHYGVHYADAEHSLETVIKGYRLVLVYSLCLPAKMVHLKKSSNKLMSDELAEAVAGPWMLLNCGELAKVELDKEQEEVSATFFRTLSELVVDASDLSLIDFFLINVYKDRFDLAAPLIPIVRKFAWDDIGPILSRWLDGVDDGKAMAVLLNIVDGLGLEKEAAPTALVKLASERALKLSWDDLMKSNIVSLLWKWLIQAGDKQMIEKVATKFKTMDPSQLGPVMEAFVENAGYIERGDDKCEVVAPVIAVRVEWLKSQIEELKKPFSWAMPNAKFPHNAQVEAFLQGTEESMTTKGIETFETLQDARNYAAQWMREEQVEASSEMEAAEEDGTAFVTITKTPDWFMEHEKKLAKYNTELKLLEECYDEVTQGGPRKQARVEASCRYGIKPDRLQ
ncbi:hypothetical protein PHYSODRAFT_247740 [Phytophthora sojae]|uniref:Uncharacterized protein n=1 Tax=Phytophthora sojae (strain P6497) TaxID=1094619 RepID=G4YZM4_PHYSP|nr:hypothetical protein PHYSODRAFT_247740 [Phytophthora sojae]EGZ25792.1 hypothetical protein PHYSODRAFT_247740 [Phytophthora sojae]|eukprot:XP_009521080.1 hypothetical protein PHYSODRAFT_247740 [Phytophthora sojae]